MGGFTVDLALEHEAPACLALLPETRGMQTELLIARRDGDLAGAAALVWQSWSSPGGFPVAVRVLPAERRRGVGRRLLQRAADLAAPETDGLWSAEPLDLDSPAALFLQACGFEPRRRQHHFLGRVDVMIEHLSPLLHRARRRGRIPPDARIVPLPQAPLDEVGWLVSAELGGGPIRALQGLRLRGAEAQAGADRSLAVLQGEKTAAVILWRVQEQVAVIDARVVAPGWRGDWPNLVLLEAALVRMKAEGVEAFRFHCDEGVRDTLSLARRCDAEETARNALFYYAIAA
jgi:GNAT superfamily N-acetyltransferase